jgi:hypothetical protein
MFFELVLRETGRFWGMKKVSCDVLDLEATTKVVMSILWYLLLAGL